MFGPQQLWLCRDIPPPRTGCRFCYVVMSALLFYVPACTFSRDTVETFLRSTYDYQHMSYHTMKPRLVAFFC